MTEQQLQQWTELKDYQVTLRRLVAEEPDGLGIPLQAIAEAALDGTVPDNSAELIALPVVQAAIDRVSRARLQASLDHLTELLEALAEAITLLVVALPVPAKKAPQGAARPLVAGKAASVVPPAALKP